MAETIAIAGKKVPKTFVIVVGAGAIGFVGYAWWTKGTSGEEPTVPVEEIPEPVEVPTDRPGFSASTGDPPPISNAEWGELAVQRLIAIGLDGPAVSSAIGEFLARKPLSTVEADLVQQAIRAAGLPPQGGPWTVLAEPIPPPVSAQPAPGPPTNLRYSGKTKTQLTVSWSPPVSTDGVTIAKYYVEFYGQHAGGATFVVSSVETASLTAKSSNNLRPDHPYGFRVRTIGANGKTSAFATTKAERTLK